MQTEWECNGNIMGILFLELKYERQSDIWVCLDIGYTPRILFFWGGERGDQPVDGMVRFQGLL